VKEVLGEDYAVSAFSNAGGDFWKGADCPTLCAKTSMASLPVIAALERGLSVISLCAGHQTTRAEPAVIIDAHNFA
jgi:hypothetical protein